MTEEEEKYIKKQEQHDIQKQRRERQMKALREKERDEIAATLNTSDEVAEEALELGFDEETARILHLVPVIQVAWADGSVSDAERDKVLELAAQRNVSEGSPAHEFLELILENKPSSLFFERTNRVIRHLVAGGSEEGASLIELCESVAEASGGFFGLTSPVSKDERRLLEELTHVFDVDDATAADIID